jgi:hypothetical protein
MGAARDLFRQVGWSVHGTPDAYEMLCRAAELWRAEGQPFSAGMAMLRAVDAAWGRPELMLDAHRAALRDFECVVAEQPPASPAALAALYKLWQTLGRALWLFEQEDRDTVRSRIRELESELSQRLLTHFTDSENADNYLVRGIIIVTDLDGQWSVQFPQYEVPHNTEQVGEEAILNIPSAFRLFVFGRDWLGAHEIVKNRKDAFTTPGLMGWRAVTLANVTPGEAVTHFDEAADAFAADTMPAKTEESVRRGGFWSSANQQLWAKYFRARARLVESIREPARVKELLGQAVDALVGTESGWHSSEVSKFNVLVKVLFSLVSDPLSFSADDARREYEAEVYRTEQALEDRLAMTFISNAADAFRGFQSDPDTELTRDRLGIALNALAKIPVIGADVADAARPEIGKNVRLTLEGPVRTWVHRSLGSIGNEAVLRRVLLRLLQGTLPRYAQIRHGPIEYGKDIAALADDGGSSVLCLYQVKCGEMNTPKWREARAELEEMFLVPMSEFQLPVSPQRIEGYLVTNGHANTHVEPVMEGWFEEQRRDHGRDITFMHLDTLVDWIFKVRLVNELRAALDEESIKIS